MAVRKIAISIPEDVIKKVDALAKKRRTTRSGFIAEILQTVTHASGQEEIRRQINLLFKDKNVEYEQQATSQLFVRSIEKKYGDWEW
ncbi:MAG: type II toxin-antitoxin system HicB family antitoxin [Bdellovibrionales bacterium]